MKDSLFNRAASLFLLILVIVSGSCMFPKTGDRAPWKEVPSILGRIIPPDVPVREFCVTDFGAEPDGLTDCKPAIDKAIEACLSAGGGKVIFSAGNYFIKGPVHLESNTRLHLSAGSCLSFSSDPADYLPVVLTSWEGTRLYNYSPFIYAINKTNVAITGEGMINGYADGVFARWQAIQRKDQLLSREMNNNEVPLKDRIFGADHFLRPHLIQFYECENILIEGVTILDSPFWCIHFIYSGNITVRDLIFASQQLNNDGIDVESCEDVLIENVHFDNRDDNIAIKSGRDAEARMLQIPSRNIVVRNCYFKGHNAFAIGSEMSGGVYNIFMENCGFRGEVRNGIYLKSNKDRGGKVSGVYVRNTRFGIAGSVIQIDSDYKNEGEG